MLEFFGFFASVVIISASGVMAPGPLFASTVSTGIREGKYSGLKVAAGHMVIELPLVIIIGIGALSLESLPQFRTIVSILGASSLFIFAGLQLWSTFRQRKPARVESKYGSFVTGIILTGLNPFFIVWWLTIGIKLISDALLLWAFSGILIMFGLHIWMDYGWLFFVSAVAAKGTKFLTDKRYRISMVAINVVLIYFGFTFIANLA
ncbi:MAG TPA: LysE family transporter [Candidatus Nitrosotenuis sp.]|nr:LysE family transporter [Candidatus Nitrosotenuis sp.]